MTSAKNRSVFVFLFFSFLMVIGFTTQNVSAETYSLQELNQNRSYYGLPLLTGDPNIDQRYFIRECMNGIQFSCTFIQQEDVSQEMDPSNPTQEELDEILQIGINAQASRPSAAVGSETRSQCLAKADALIQQSIDRGGAGVTGIFSAERCYNLPN